MFSKQRLVVAVLAAILVAGLSACGSGNSGSPGSGGTAGHGSGKVQETRPDTVSGVKDRVRHVTRKYRKASRPHMLKECKPATKRIKHTKRTGTGSGNRKKTRTWYTTKRYQDCDKVRKGTETYRKVVRRQRWCVKLDDVDGKKTKDDVWYRVDRETYRKAADKDERAPLKIAPRHDGC